MYKCSIPLKPGPAGDETEAACCSTCGLGWEMAAFRALGITALKAMEEVLPFIFQLRWGRLVS